MPERFPEIAQSQEDLEALLKATRDAQVQRRVHLLLLIRTGAVKTRMQAANHLRVHRNSIHNWLKIYKTKGMERLLRIDQGAPPAEQKTMPDEVYQALQARLAENGFPNGYIEVQRWLKQEFQLEVPYKTLHGILRYRLKAKLKRARPSHVKKTKLSSLPSPAA
jgi:transposase